MKIKPRLTFQALVGPNEIDCKLHFYLWKVGLEIVAIKTDELLLDARRAGRPPQGRAPEG